jgi:hypothetical protein
MDLNFHWHDLYVAVMGFKVVWLLAWLVGPN